MQEKNTLKAVLGSKCPNCREGNIFTYPLSRIGSFAATNKSCDNCGFKFEPEPGFFYGAMYISYVFIVGILLTTGFVLYNFFNDPDLWVYVLSAPTITIVLLPLIFRFSRVIYIYAFSGAKYNKKMGNS